MSNINSQGLIDIIKNMSIMELAEVVKQLEDTFNISAASLVSAPSASNSNNEAPQEKSSYDIVLKAIGSSKMNVIRVVNKILSTSLKEAKDTVEGTLPKTLKPNVPKSEAEEFKKQLVEAGAEVELV